MHGGGHQHAGGKSVPKAQPHGMSWQGAVLQQPVVGLQVHAEAAESLPLKIWVPTLLESAWAPARGWTRFRGDTPQQTL